MAQTEWQQLIADCVEETLRVVDNAEDFIYDYVVPQLLETGDPAERRQFLETLDLNTLRQTAPKLWSRYSSEALDMVSREQQAARKRLDDLSYEQYKADRAFRPELMPARMFGLRTGNETTTTVGQGLESSLPLGVFR